MAYNGGMLPEFHGNLDFTKETFRFLKKVLLAGIKKKYPLGDNQCSLMKIGFILTIMMGTLKDLEGMRRYILMKRKFFLKITLVG